MQARLLFAALLLSSPTQLLAGNYSRYVNPLFATRGGAGMGGWGCQARNPGAMAPAPFLRLGPDTTRFDPILGEAWSHLNRHAGYFGSDTHIRAFSHTHVQGAGDADLGTVGVMPFRGGPAAIAAAAAKRPLPLPFPPLTLDRSPFAAPFSHADEAASPGAYSVALPSLATQADLLASGTHAGLHRYACAANGTIPPSGGAPVAGPCALIVDVCHRAHQGPCGAASTVQLRVTADGSGVVEVEAVHQDRGEFVRFNYTGVLIFFYARISAVDPASGAPLPPWAAGVWSGYASRPASPAGNASATVGADLDSLGAYAVFPSPATLLVRVGLSTVSAAGARANLVAEQGGGSGGGGSGGGLVSFEAVAEAIDAAWDAALGAAHVRLPADAAQGVTDAGALARGGSGSGSGSGSGAEKVEEKEAAAASAAAAPAFAAAGAALEAFLATPLGLAHAFDAGWVVQPLPPLLLAAVGAARRGAEGSASLLAAAPPPSVDLAAASAALRSAAAASAAAATAAAAATTAGGGGSHSDLAVFYTMLYLSLCAPSTYSDADGRYLGFDFAVHPADAPGSAFLSDLSLWDTYRAQAPLLALLAPRTLADTAGSLLSMTAQGGKGMPRWPFANLYTGDMIGHHGFELLVDCVLVWGACGGRVGVGEAAAAVLAEAGAQDASVPAYPAPGGYVPVGSGSASVTLEWALNDFSTAAFAGAVGNASAAAAYGARAGSFAAVFSPATPAVLPRYANGSFENAPSVWAPHPFNAWFTEGNAAQWMWAVPHNVPGLLALFPGGAEEFAAVLQVVLANQTQWTSVLSTFLPNPFAWLGNEPSMLLPWQHAWAGAAHAWRAQFWPRWHLRAYYPPTQDAIPGNDDYGTLSSWAVWAYLGLYPVAGTGVFALGSPVFEDAVVAAPLGARAYSGAAPPTLHVVAHNASSARIYVAAVRVNGGEALPEPLVTWAQLWPAGGGEALLEFFMVDAPSVWGGGE